MTEEQAQMLADCAQRDHKLTDWEASFINDLMLREPKVLTAKQDQCINDIWDRVTA